MIILICLEIKERPEIWVWYLTLIFARFFTLLSTSFYTSWVSSFYEDEPDGRKKAIATANNILFWGNVAMIPLSVVVGLLGDRVKSKILFPLFGSFLGLAWALIYLSSHPYSPLAFIGQIIHVWSTNLLNLANMSLMFKVCGNKIRGIIIGIGIFFGSIAITSSGKIYGALFVLDPYNPFLFGLSFNGLYLVILAVLITLRVFKS